MQEQQVARSEPKASEDQREGDKFPADRAARAAIDAAARYAALVRRDAIALDALREHAGRRGSFFRVVPELHGDVHDLSGLLQVAAALAQPPGAREGGKCDEQARRPSRRGGAQRSTWQGVTARTRPRARARRSARARARRHAKNAVGEALETMRALLDAASLAASGAPAAASPLFASVEGWIARASRGFSADSGLTDGLAAEIAAALEQEIARWEQRAKSDDDARPVLRAFLGLREVLWELGVRAPRGGRGRARRPRALPRPRRVQRVAVQGDDAAAPRD